MPPVRLKLYGILWMTRRRYVQQLVLAAGFAAGFFVLWWQMWPGNRGLFDAAESPALERFIWIMDHAPWILLGVALLQFLEAYLVLRAFRRKEAEQSGSN